MSAHTPGPWTASQQARGEWYVESAAAPDLLRELKRTVVRLERCILAGGTDPEYAAIALEDARAAIARAEGTSP